jgi:hypothetical protein
MLLLGAAALAAAVVVAVLIASGGGGSNGDNRAASRPATTQRATKRKAPAPSRSTSTATTTAGAASPAPSAEPTSPAGAVQAFYTRAAAHRYNDAWALAAPGLRSQLGGFGRFRNQFSSVKSIVFSRAATIRQSASAATVAITTTATHTDRVQHCNGTIDTAPASGGGWVVTHLAVSC